MRGSPLSDDAVTLCVLAVASGDLAFTRVKGGWKVQKAGSASCGLSKGDVIFEVNRQPLGTHPRLAALWDSARQTGHLLIKGERLGHAMFLSYAISVRP